MAPQIETTPLWQTLDFWNFVIAVLALLAAFYSIWYTRQRDKTKLEIVNTWYEKPDGNPYFVVFKIFNNSSTAVKITNLTLLHLDGKIVEIIKDYKYKPPYRINLLGSDYRFDPFHESKVFDREEIIPANAETSFKYYLNSFSTDMKIKVTADRPIYRWSKTKTFSVHFVKTD
ncbi:hypothetical protein [Streptococcus suis]|uniref:hypothetical protein n=2 Tax=Streptococcus suis TaxID=1307 RepID=UPI000CF3BAF4|nr:hypothetical protein [Streptococcus suis]MBL1126288.1 hypothetical protein [Streptococcus suis]MBY5026042.1 hypothetical protein [Streptococcus suis]MCK3935677.1 hypothetical protein [Streptococcus suis]NQL54743.1 hypothetical protein [Streptococcus suis]QZT16357.1 hypothetical protein K6974_06985 [Streptococcus suis]